MLSGLCAFVMWCVSFRGACFCSVQPPQQRNANVFYLCNLMGQKEFLLLLFSLQVVSNSFVPLWTIAHQAPLSMGFYSQEYWSGLPCPSPGDLPHPGIKPASPASAHGFFTTEPPKKPVRNNIRVQVLLVLLVFWVRWSLSSVNSLIILLANFPDRVAVLFLISFGKQFFRNFSHSSMVWVFLEKGIFGCFGFF